MNIDLAGLEDALKVLGQLLADRDLYYEKRRNWRRQFASSWAY